MKTILDVCCGSRMFHFEKQDKRVAFCDKRELSTTLLDKTAKGGIRSLHISPDFKCDFTKLPFQSGSFPLIIFDPPHLEKVGNQSWLAKKYGKLNSNWKDEIRAGFAECFRVLAPLGTLIFKWNETDIPVSEILKLTDNQPVFGNKSGKHSKTHWIVFQKPAEAIS